METKIQDLLSTLSFGEICTHGNMCVVPLISPEQNGPAYLTMGQAFDLGILTIKEVSESGAVPELAFVNKGDEYVLLLDGEEVQGAKQNRVLNTSVLIAPKSEGTIPVSCTEQGRWAYRSKTFEDSNLVVPSSLRMKKMASVSQSIKRSESYLSNQVEVWNEVAAYHCRLDTSSPTSALRDAFLSKKKELDAIAEAFAHIEGVNGIAVFLSGKVAGIDLLSYIPAMDHVLPKLIRSYAMSAMASDENDDQGDPSIEQVEAFIARVGRCAVEAFPSKGVGEDARIEGPTIQGAALIAMETVIHLALFANDQSPSQGRMASFDHRRRFRGFSHF